MAEMHRMPLDKVVLDLKQLVEGEVRPTLREVLEPPEESNVENAFGTLFELGMISEANDLGLLTEVGRVASALPCDLRVSRMIVLSIRLGITLEGIRLAAAVSNPRSPFRQISPLVTKDCGEYNSLCTKLMESKQKFDCKTLSYPIMIRNALVAWEEQSLRGIGPRRRWCQEQGLVDRQLRNICAAQKPCSSGPDP